MTTSLRPGIRLPAALAFMLGICGVQPTAWTLAAQTTAPPPAANSGECDALTAITDDAIEQRARFLALSANVGERAKEHFQRLVKSESTENQLRNLQQDVVSSNPGRSREELLAIFQERQKELGIAFWKQAVESARADLLPKLRKDAREELIGERQKFACGEAARDRGRR